MTATSRPAGAHIVGRFPLEGPEDVFRTISEHPGPLLRSMPDGETETNWVLQQFDILASVPQLERRFRTGYGIDTPFPCIGLRDGIRADDVTFPERLAVRSSRLDVPESRLSPARCASVPAGRVPPALDGDA
jgi:hypothetical protein